MITSAVVMVVGGGGSPRLRIPWRDPVWRVAARSIFTASNSSARLAVGAMPLATRRAARNNSRSASDRRAVVLEACVAPRPAGSPELQPILAEFGRRNVPELSASELEDLDHLLSVRCELLDSWLHDDSSVRGAAW